MKVGQLKALLEQMNPNMDIEIMDGDEEKDHGATLGSVIAVIDGREHPEELPDDVCYIVMK